MCSTVLQPREGKHSEASLFNRAANRAIDSDTEPHPIEWTPRPNAETQDVVITRHGKPAGVLIGFKSEDDWFDYRLENDPRFLQRVVRVRHIRGEKP